jgi:ribonuclease BN (tRNA processing enzyme)
MHIRLLGVHQGESRNTKFLSIVVDEVLAIDAGSLTSGLTFEEQKLLRAVLVTHYHYDHIKDIPMIGFNNINEQQLTIYCMASTREALQSHIMNQNIWPTLHNIPVKDPALIYRDVEPGVRVEIEGYSVLPLPMHHSVPTVGYNLSRNGKSFFFTSDTRGEAHEAWAMIKPDLIITESTLPDDHADEAYRFGHMTPRTIVKEMRDFYSIHHYFPRIVAVHINPHYEEQVRAELEMASEALGSPIEVGYEGMRLHL